LNLQKCQLTARNRGHARRAPRRRCRRHERNHPEAAAAEAEGQNV